MKRARITLWVFIVGFTTILAGRYAWKSWKSRELGPAQMLAYLKVPSGFTVELVASEPTIAHPLAMTFDERGRLWIVESPTSPADASSWAPGRIKILESSQGDGTFDNVSDFPAPLKMPSGIAVGHGGVWIADAPDIKFIPIHDGVPGEPEVVVTGFGEQDANGLPNSLSWGPDGWLYGLSSVWCTSHVVHQGKVFDFSCAVFRIQPQTRAFEVFAEGTSNPWGITWDTEGNAFVCACVTDHLWHMTETGVYRRIAGAYPAFYWALGSIEKERHGGHSHCGLHFFDSEAYPEKYREKLFMGNVTSDEVNIDGLKRRGATYEQVPQDDFIKTANYPWFTPVAVMTGPDGLLYVLDWHDKRHCDHDMLRRPRRASKPRGRLIRVRYGDGYQPAGRFDLAQESDEQLVQRLRNPNIYFRATAQRLLGERLLAKRNSPATRTLLQQRVQDSTVEHKYRMHALWALIGGGALEPEFHLALLHSDDTGVRAWGVRAAGLFRHVTPAIRDRIAYLAADEEEDVRLQVAIAVRKIDGLDPLPPLIQVARASRDDPLIPAIVWQNLLPLLERRGPEVQALIEKPRLPGTADLGPITAHAFAYLLGRPGQDPARMVDLFESITEKSSADPDVVGQLLASLADKIQTGELTPDRLGALQARALAFARQILQGSPDDPRYRDAALLAATLKVPEGIAIVHKMFTATAETEEVRLKALAALIAGKDPQLREAVTQALSDRQAETLALRNHVLAALGRSDDAWVADVVLPRFAQLEPDLQPQAIDLLVQRPLWSKRLLRAIDSDRVPAKALNANHLRQLLASKDAELLALLLASKDAELVAQVKAQRGTVRQERNPEREKVVAEMRKLLQGQHGDPVRGQLVFHKLCGQCHMIYGKGADVGPDLTTAGRASYEQLLVKVFDPNQIVKPGFQVVTVYTTKGRAVAGLVKEDNAQRLVLKTQGGKEEIIPRAEVETVETSKVSLMPEGIEKQLRPEEIVDLFAFLTLDHPPGDSRAHKIPGSPP